LVNTATNTFDSRTHKYLATSNIFAQTAGVSQAHVFATVSSQELPRCRKLRSVLRLVYSLGVGAPEELPGWQLSEIRVLGWTKLFEGKSCLWQVLSEFFVQTYF